MADNNEGNTTVQDLKTNSKWFNLPLLVFFEDVRKVFKLDSIGRELLGMAVPAAMAVAADPIASLVDTAFIGHIGPVELAAAGVSITLFNQASRITIFPLVSVTTSFVAEEDTLKKISDIEKGLPSKENDNNNNNADDDENDNVKKNNSDHNENIHTNNTTSKSSSLNASSGNKNQSKKTKKKKQIASASTALIFGTILGLIQASLLIFAAKPLLLLMGAKPDSAMLILAERFLKLRALGSPAVLIALCMQGIFRGFKDTTTPLYVIVSGYSLNVALDPILIFYFKFGLQGAAMAHVISQYLMALALFVLLMRKVNLTPPTIKDLQIFRFLRNGGLLMARVVAVTFVVTFAASLATRLGPITMAAHQTCQQVWITSSLLSDGLAIAIQAILACSFAEKNYAKAKEAAVRILQITFVMGVGLSIIVGFGLGFGATVFTKTPSVLHLIKIGFPFVAASQPINALSFVFDGVNYGASDFTYAAVSLVLVSIVSVGIEYVLYKMKGFIGIWIALTIYMGLRMLAGIWRMGTGTGPWRFLRG